MIRTYLEKMLPILSKPVDKFLALKQSLSLLFKDEKLPEKMIVDGEDLIPTIKGGEDAVRFFRIEFGLEHPSFFKSTGSEVLDAYFNLGEDIDLVTAELDFITERYARAFRNRPESVMFDIETVKDIKDWLEMIRKAWLALKKRDGIHRLLKTQLKNKLKANVVDYLPRNTKELYEGVFYEYSLEGRISFEIYRRQAYYEGKMEPLTSLECAIILFTLNAPDKVLKEFKLLLDGDPDTTKEVKERFEKFVEERKRYLDIYSTYLIFENLYPPVKKFWSYFFAGQES